MSFEPTRRPVAEKIQPVANAAKPPVTQPVAQPAMQRSTVAPRPMQAAAQPVRVMADMQDDKIKFRDYQQMVAWLDQFRKTANVPAHFKTGDVSVLVQAVQMLINMGLPWLNFLDKTSFVNNRLGVMSDAIAAAVRATGMLEVDELEYFDEDGNPDAPNNVKFKPYACVYTGKRKGDRKERWYRYTLDDKKSQGLGRNGGAWATNPRDMLKHRARTRVLRDLFPDIIGGVACVEVDECSEPAKPQVSSSLQQLVIDASSERNDG